MCACDGTSGKRQPLSKHWGKSPTKKGIRKASLFPPGCLHGRLPHSRQQNTGNRAVMDSRVVSALRLPITFLNSSYCYRPLSLSGGHKQVFNFKVNVEVTLKVWEIPFPGCVWTQFLSPAGALECGLPGGAPSGAAEVRARLSGRLSPAPTLRGETRKSGE